jgi:ribosome biogenesis GTPase
VDTPGFFFFFFENIAPRQIAEAFHEFAPHSAECKFNDCIHDNNSAHCAVKAEVGKSIHPARYAGYLGLIGR